MKNLLMLRTEGFYSFSLDLMGIWVREKTEWKNPHLLHDGFSVRSHQIHSTSLWRPPKKKKNRGIFVAKNIVFFFSVFSCVDSARLVPRGKKRICLFI